MSGPSTGGATAPDFDLQSHSTYSDGSLPPAEVVRAAAEAGVRLLALTDHDTVAGVDEALAAGRRLGVEVVSGTELSAIDGLYQDLHVLGYGLDHHHLGLLERLEAYRQEREARARAMADRLRALGYELEESSLQARATEGRPIGRPHLAAAVVGHPANATRLQEEGLDEVTPFLVEYLTEGKPAFVGRTFPTVREAIEVIHTAGGLAVWAHPFWDLENPDEVLTMIDRFVGWDLDGVEAFYTTHSREQAAVLARRCEALGLLTTGSADYHGPEHRLFSAFRAFAFHDHKPHLGSIAGGRGPEETR